LNDFWSAGESLDGDDELAKVGKTSSSLRGRVTMDQAAELAGMDVDQLTEVLSRADGELEDVLDEREFVLGQTGVHIGAVELSRLRNAWAKDEARLQERLAAIHARLADLESMP
jgi:hypothetical protein